MLRKLRYANNGRGGNCTVCTCIASNPIVLVEAHRDPLACLLAYYKQVGPCTFGCITGGSFRFASRVCPYGTPSVARGEASASRRVIHAGRTTLRVASTIEMLLEYENNDITLLLEYENNEFSYCTDRQTDTRIHGHLTELI